MADNEKRTDRGYVEQTLLLPRRLWERIESMCESSNKEPGELVADALRLLVAGGVPTSAASVGGTSSGLGGIASIVVGDIDTDDIEALVLAVAGEALESETLRQQLTKIIHLVEAKEQSSVGHSEAVATLATELATKLALDANQIRHIELGALLHDLGKSQVPDAILGKRGRLTPEEWKLVKHYPRLGADMIDGVAALGDSAFIVRHHQERWDGSGYPEGQSGDEIPIGAQIVGICDVYQVLTSERAYRPALSPEIARLTIESGVGRLWNPDLAERLLEIVDA